MAASSLWLIGIFCAVDSRSAFSFYVKNPYHLRYVFCSSTVGSQMLWSEACPFHFTLITGPFSTICSLTSFSTTNSSSPSTKIGSVAGTVRPYPSSWYCSGWIQDMQKYVLLLWLDCLFSEGDNCSVFIKTVTGRAR